MFFYNLSLYQNERVTVIDLGNENEQNIVSYSQWRKLKIALEKKFQTIAIIFHILPLVQVGISRCRVYINRH